MKTRNIHKLNSLLIAAIKGDVNTIKLLHEKSENIDATDEEGNTAFMLAIEAGQLEAAKLLLDAGANPNHKNSLGETVLNLAIENQQLESIKFLSSIKTKYNIQVNQQIMNVNGRWGDTVLIQAIKKIPDLNSSNKDFELKIYLEIINELLKAEADPSLSIHGKNAWDIAKEENAPNEVIALLDASLQITASGKALHEAIENNDYIAFEKILKHARESGEINHLVNQPDLESGNSPLIAAFYKSNLRMMALLLENNANPHQTNRWGESVLMHVQTSKFKPLHKLFAKFKTDTPNLEQETSKRASDIIRANHLLGLESKTTLQLMGLKRESLVESGAIVGNSLETLTEIMSSYIKILPPESRIKKQFDDILSSYNIAHDLLQDKTTAKNLVDRLNHHQLVVIPSGWEGHTVALCFAKTKDDTLYEMVSNRGEGMLEIEGEIDTGTMIYTIKPEDHAHVNEQYFKDITECQVAELLPDDMFPRIYKYINPYEPNNTLPTKGQGHGTCTLVNFKSLCILLLYHLKKEELSEALKNKEFKLLKEIQEQFGIEIKTSQDIEKVAKSYAKSQYKNFTTFLRNYEVSRLIKHYKNARNSEKTFYRSLLTDYLLQHYGQKNHRKNRESKRNEELNRAFEILDALSEVDKGIVIKQLESHGATLLISAAEVGHLRLCSLLMANGASLLQKNSFNDTPLSASLSHDDVFKLFLGKTMGSQEFIYEVQCGHVSVLTRLLKEDSIQKWLYEANHFQLVLDKAIGTNQGDVFKYLIEVFKGSIEENNKLIGESFELALKTRKGSIIKELLLMGEGRVYIKQRMENKVIARLISKDIVHMAIEEKNFELLNYILGLNFGLNQGDKQRQAQLELVAFKKVLKTSSLTGFFSMISNYNKTAQEFLNDPINISSIQQYCNNAIEQHDRKFLNALLSYCNNIEIRENLKLGIFHESIKQKKFDIIDILFPSERVESYINDDSNRPALIVLLEKLSLDKNISIMEILLDHIKDNDVRMELYEIVFIHALTNNIPSVAENFSDIGSEYLSDPENKKKISEIIKKLAKDKALTNIVLILDNCEDPTLRDELAMEALKAGIENNFGVLVNAAMRVKYVHEFLNNPSHKPQLLDMLKESISRNGLSVLFNLANGITPSELKKDILIESFNYAAFQGSPEMVAMLFEFEEVTEWFNSTISNMSLLIEEVIRNQSALILAILLDNINNIKLQIELCKVMEPMLANLNNPKMFMTLKSCSFVYEYFKDKKLFAELRTQELTHESPKVDNKAFMPGFETLANKVPSVAEPDETKLSADKKLGA